MIVADTIIFVKLLYFCVIIFKFLSSSILRDGPFNFQAGGGGGGGMFFSKKKIF